MAGKAKAAPAAAPAQLEVVDTCGLCHWWKHISGGVGRCKRFPPVPMPGSAGVWPLSLAEDYCGEFEARAAEPAKPVGFAPPGPLMIPGGDPNASLAPGAIVRTNGEAVRYVEGAVLPTNGEAVRRVEGAA